MSRLGMALQVLAFACCSGVLIGDGRWFLGVLCGITAPALGVVWYRVCRTYELPVLPLA